MEERIKTPTPKMRTQQTTNVERTASGGVPFKGKDGVTYLTYPALEAYERYVRSLGKTER